MLQRIKSHMAIIFSDELQRIIRLGSGELTLAVFMAVLSHTDLSQ